jgi:hypothetical protein
VASCGMAVMVDFTGGAALLLLLWIAAAAAVRA